MNKQKYCVLWATGFIMILLSACSTSIMSELQTQTEELLETKNVARYDNISTRGEMSVTKKQESQSFPKAYSDKITSNTDARTTLVTKEKMSVSRATSRESQQQNYDTYGLSEKEMPAITQITENNIEIQKSDMILEHSKYAVVSKAFDMETDYKMSVLDGVNSYRKSALAIDQNLSAIAQSHSMKMALQKKAWHECSGIESVAAGAYRDGFLEGTILTIHCSDLAADKVKRIGVGAARDENGSIYVCVYAKTY